MSDISLSNLTLCHLRAEAFEEIFVDLLHDIQYYPFSTPFFFGVDPHDLRVSLVGNVRSPHRGAKYVTMPYLWKKFMEKVDRSDLIEIILPPAGVLEFFAHIHWQTTNLRRQFRYVKEIAESTGRDLDRLRAQVESVLPSLLKVLESESDAVRMASGGLLDLQKLYKKRKIVSIGHIFPSVSVSSLPLPSEIDTERGLRWLEHNRHLKRGVNADFFDRSDMLNFEVFVRTLPIFRDRNAYGAMTSMGYYTRQAYGKSWSGERRLCPSRHPAVVTTLLMLRREMDDVQHMSDYLQGGIMLLREIRRQIWEIPEARDALGGAKNVPGEKRISVSERLDAAIGYWIMNYFFPIFQVQPPEPEEETDLDALVSFLRGAKARVIDEKIEQASEAISRKARAIFHEDFEETLEDPELLPLDNPLAKEVFDWLTGA